MGDDIQKQGKSYEEEEEVMEEKEGFSLPPIPKVALFGGVGILVAILLIVMVVGGLKEKGTEADSSGETSSTEYIPQFAYTPEEKEELRLLGFTGDDVYAFETEAKDAATLISNAKEKRKEYLEELDNDLKEAMQNPESAEFKKLKELTWLSGETLIMNEDASESWREVSTAKEIVRYTKLPARGSQLYVRITTEDGLVLFMHVHPKRYMELREEGGMVITYDVVKYDGKSFVLNVKEVEV